MDSPSQPPTEQPDGHVHPRIESATSPETIQPIVDVAAPAIDTKDATGAGPQDTEVLPSGVSADAENSEPALAYGTRSRNRTRINYAEDQDMADFDFVAPPAKAALAKTPGVSETKRNQQVASDTKGVVPDITATRFISVNGLNQPEKSPSSGRDPIPGTSTFSSNSQKKRKAAGNAASSAGVPGPSATAQPSAKRQSTASGYVPPANSIDRASNMLTFHKSGAVLRAGSLIADNGTALKVDGMSRLATMALYGQN